MAAEIGVCEEKLALLVGRSCAGVPLTEIGMADTVGCRDGSASFGLKLELRAALLLGEELGGGEDCGKD